MQSVQNLGLAVISIVAGKLVDSNGYLVLEVFFLAWLCRKIFYSCKVVFSRAVFIGGSLESP